MENNIVTYDFAEFGRREIAIAAKLLQAYSDNIQEGDCLSRFGGNVKIGFNKNSGNVWLEDEDCNCLMLQDEGKLAQWYFLFYQGQEGFALTLFEYFLDGEIDSEDWEQLADILEQEGYLDEASQVQNAIDNRERGD